MLKRILSPLVMLAIIPACTVDSGIGSDDSGGETPEPQLAQVLDGEGERPDGLAAQSEGALGIYAMNTHYNGNIPAVKGWEIEWRVPQVSNGDVAWGAIGTWFWNLEAGLYLSPDGWAVYYFGDDNGVTGNEPQCNSMWGSGGTCGGVFGNLQPGRQIVFKYQYCNSSNRPSVSGDRLCLWVDLKDGFGSRFLASDFRTTQEMYAHDVETFEDSGFAAPQIPCNAPVKMVRQRYQDQYGWWRTMTGLNTWTFQDNSSLYKFQNKKLTSTPATWETCSG